MKKLLLIHLFLIVYGCRKGTEPSKEDPGQVFKQKIDMLFMSETSWMVKDNIYLSAPSFPEKTFNGIKFKVDGTIQLLGVRYQSKTVSPQEYATDPVYYDSFDFWVRQSNDASKFTYKLFDAKNLTEDEKTFFTVKDILVQQPLKTLKKGIRQKLLGTNANLHEETSVVHVMTLKYDHENKWFTLERLHSTGTSSHTLIKAEN